MAIIITTPNSDVLGAANTVPHFVPEVWSDDVLEAAQFAEAIIPRFNRTYGSELSKGDVLHVARISNLGTTNIPNDGSDLTFEAPQESKQDIVVDQQKYAAIMVGSITKVQANKDLMALYARKLGYAHTRVKEVFMGAKFASFSTNVMGTLGVELVSDDYRTIWQTLKEAGIMEEGTDPSEEFSIMLSPAAYAAALNVDVFANRQYNTEGNAITRANVGDIYGFRVFLSNLLTASGGGHQCFAGHRDALAFVDQMAYKVESDRLVQKLADVVVAWSVYGGSIISFPPEADPGSATYTATDNRGIYVKTV